MRERFVWLFNLVVVTTTLVVIVANFVYPIQTATETQNGVGTAALRLSQRLVFAVYPNPLNGEEVVNLDDISVSILAHALLPNGLLDETVPPTSLFTQPDPPACETDNLFASPDGNFLAVQYNCEADLFVRLFNTTQAASPTVLPRGYFLDWSPDSHYLLFRQVDNQQIWLISVGDDQEIVPRILNLPSFTYQASFAPNGENITYVASDGLGFGSEIGVYTLSTDSFVVQQEFPNQVVATPRWSPDGKQLSYVLMPDNNIPYKVGELWLANANAQPINQLAPIDAGHGYPPVWSPDSRVIFYIHRENPDDNSADYHPASLNSNIYQVDSATGDITQVTAFEKNLVTDIVLSPKGDQITFSANDAVWLLTPGETPIQLSQSGIARHPAWINTPTTTK